MKYVDEFRNFKIARDIAGAISSHARGLGGVNFMEVCGTHTMAVERFGIRRMLPRDINLISGPGCPVCVTPKDYIDRAIGLAGIKDVTVASFGDMLKVPGSDSTLAQERGKGKVRVVYSVLDAMDFAAKNPDKKIVFLGIGFETTVPTVAASMELARKRKIRNFFVYSGHKVMPPAMDLLARDKRINIQGFLCPAHVSAVIGTGPYAGISKKYKIPCVISGFEPLDILQSILMLVKQLKSGRSEVENQYARVVRRSGNRKALALMSRVFSEGDSEWRGMGIIPKSGLSVNKAYSDLDAGKVFRLPRVITRPDKGCVCGEVLKGIKTPRDCRLFGKSCTPENPRGACMVSGEGACAAYYRYRK
ncbi:MAG: hydrogenase formation protein HypD [Candidatus Omnitrophota bacterium]